MRPSAASITTAPSTACGRSVKTPARNRTVRRIRPAQHTEATCAPPGKVGDRRLGQAAVDDEPAEQARGAVRGPLGDHPWPDVDPVAMLRGRLLCRRERLPNPTKITASAPTNRPTASLEATSGTPTDGRPVGTLPTIATPWAERPSAADTAMPSTTTISARGQGRDAPAHEQQQRDRAGADRERGWRSCRSSLPRSARELLGVGALRRPRPRGSSVLVDDETDPEAEDEASRAPPWRGSSRSSPSAASPSAT